MIGIELLVVLAAIYLGARIGSIGIGFAGGLAGREHTLLVI